MIDDGCVAFPLVMFGEMPIQPLGIYSTSYETEEAGCIHPIDRFASNYLRPVLDMISRNLVASATNRLEKLAS